MSEHGCRNYWSTIDPQVPNLISSLKGAGYRTGMFGKNHLYTYDKLSLVWYEYREVCLGNYDGHPKFEKSYSAFEMEPDHEYNQTARLTDETIAFIQNTKKPFVAWVNYQDPHPAFTCPEPYKSLFDPESVSIPESFHKYDSDAQPIRNEVWRRHSQMDTCTENEIREAISAYMGQIRYVDDSVGRLLESLATSGLDSNTIVLFFSDHGELLGDYRMMHKLPVFYDCLSKIPVIVRHPDKSWAGEAFSGLCEEIDLAPTLLELLGIEKPPTMVGQSWVQALNDHDYAGKDSILCEAGGGGPTAKAADPNLKLKSPHLPTSLGPGSMIRMGDWKLSVYFDDRNELYNLADDPHELNNLHEDDRFAEKRNELAMALLQRVIGVKVRDVGIEWPTESMPVDYRFESLLKTKPDPTHITGTSGKSRA